MSMDRRDFLAAASAVLVGSVFEGRARAQAPGQEPRTLFTPLRRSVGTFSGQGGVIAWHVDKKAVVVVDSQFPATARLCLDGVKQRSGGRGVDCLVNTHHHGDHTAGNAVFQPETKRILAHVNVPTLQKEAAARAAASATGQAPEPPVFANSVYEHAWREEAGSEFVAVRHYGAAHTSGDSVVTFEKANVVHMGDLVFNRRHPFIDRPAGASIVNWMKVLEAVAADHDARTIYVFGHAGPKFGETGSKADLAYMRDYLAALLEFVQAQTKVGKPRETIVKITDPLPRFPDHGPLVERVLGAAYDELAG